MGRLPDNTFSLSLVHTRSFESLESCRKAQKTNDSNTTSLSYNLNDRGFEPGITFSVSPDNTTYTCNSGRAKMLKGLRKDFTSLPESHTKSYEENLFNKCIKRLISLGKGL